MAGRPDPDPERSFFQVGVIVADLDAAMKELGEALGLRWEEPRTRELGPWTIRVVFSRQGPPFLELIEGQEGSPWDTGPGDRLDHIGYWSQDLGAEQEHLIGQGLPMEIDGSGLSGPWSYHGTAHSGMRVELLDASLRDGFMKTRRGEDD
jgi:hypothetical protein